MGLAHEVMDPPLIAHCATVSPLEFATRADVAATMATCTASLDRPKAVTIAESVPGLGCVAKTIVSDVVNAAEIEPTVPLLSVTTLPAAEGSKLNPFMTSVVEATSRLAEPEVTTGRGGTKENTMEEVCGSPVLGSTGSAERGTAVTANLLF
jgi:hypothetical protein